MARLYRVWPDGTIQDENEEAHEWMGKDFNIIEAESEEEAIEKSDEINFCVWLEQLTGN